MKPAAPLPWKAEERGATVHRWVVTGKGLVCQVSRRSGQQENAAYIAHSANAYARLVADAKETVEFLGRLAVVFREGTGTYDACAERADALRDLLRELGEVK